MTKIIRTATVSESISFFRDVMLKMREKGYDMVAISSPGKELDNLKGNDGFHTIAVPMERRISIIRDCNSLFSLIKVFRKEKPKIVHSITPKAGLLCMLASWFTRVPVRIHTFTGLVWPTATGLSRKVLIMTDKITCACATHIIPEGQGVMNDLSSCITKKQMRVLGYGNVRGIDLNRFDPNRFLSIKKDKNRFTFFFVGRIVGDKGINELVWAFSKIHQQYPNTVLKLVGYYEPKLDPLAASTVEEITNNEAVEANGSLFDEDLIRAYAEADCFVMPSYREGFPNSVLEAGAMGLPQIVTDINGSREIISDGFNGLIVPPKDKEALYDAMLKLYQDDLLRQKLASNAREAISTRFERSFVQQCQIDFYEEILNSIKD